MFKIGDRVKPLKKSYLCGLNKCFQWKIGKEQGYLYVVGFWENGYVLNAYKDETGGSLYCYNDVVICSECDDKYFNEIKSGIYIKDMEITPEWYRPEKFIEAIEGDESLICISDLNNDFVQSFNLNHIKKIYKYLEKVIEYCELHSE